MHLKSIFVKKTCKVVKSIKQKHTKQAETTTTTTTMAQTKQKSKNNSMDHPPKQNENEFYIGIIYQIKY